MSSKLLCVGLFSALLAANAGAEEILIGQTIALSGSLAEHGKAINAGAQAYFSRINAAGGINGRQIRLKLLDDAGDSGKAAENTRLLIEKEKVLAVFGGAEGGPCVASMKVAAELKTPLVACLAGAPEFRESYNRYIFPVRAGHKSEFARLFDTGVQFGWRRFAFLHANSDSGRKHLANVQKSLARHGLELALAIPLSAKPDPEQIAAQLAAANIDGVFNHGGYSLFADVIKATVKRGGATRYMAVNSGAQQMVALLGADAKGLIFTQVVPFPWGVTPKVVKEYQIDFRRLDPKSEFSFSSLEGYLSAKVLVAGLQQLSGAPTRDGLVDGLERLGNYNLGGYEVHYSTKEHAGSSFVDTVIATKDGRFVH